MKFLEIVKYNKENKKPELGNSEITYLIVTLLGFIIFIFSF